MVIEQHLPHIGFGRRAACFLPSFMLFYIKTNTERRIRTMADFIKFGQSMLGVAKTCCTNQDQSDIAAFLLLQQDAIQSASAEARRSGAAAKPAAGKPAAGQAGVPSGDAPGAAMARLQAMLKQKK